MATNEQHNLGTTRDDDVTTSDRALVIAVKGSASEPLPVTVSTGGSGTTAAVSRVASVAADTLLLAANANRRSAGFCNNSTSANLYIKLGTGASLAAGAESFTVKVPPGGFFRLYLNEYNGIVHGIWDAAEAGAECLITEVT